MIWIGMGGPLFMDLFYLFEAIYQLGHCPVACSSCNIDFIYIDFISFYLFILSNVFYYFM